jgi:cytochrome c-type biogenesis protein CcmE
VKKRAKFAVGIAIIVVTLSCLAYVGAQQSKTYYHTIAEIPTLNGSALHQRLRVGGDVKTGSIQHYSGRVDFDIVEQGKTLPVSYVGTDPLPDTFKDGAQCLVEGKVQPDGRFVAETVQAKCASKYEAAPGGQGQQGTASGDSYQNGKS